MADELITLLVFVYFLIYIADIHTLFSDRRKMEEKNVIKIYVIKMKRTCIIVYILYYSYNIFSTLCSIYNHVTDNDPIKKYLMIVLNPFYVTWNKFENIFSELLFSFFFTPWLISYRL